MKLEGKVGMVTGAGQGLGEAIGKALAKEGVNVVPAQAGTRLSLGDGVWAEVLHPGGVPAGDKLNDHSVVLRIGLGQVSFLLPGDIEAEVERKLSANGPSLGAMVLKAPHHGSSTSSSETFLTAVDPQVAVVSVGADNRFGHPAPEVLDRLAAVGARVMRTDQHGTIEVISDGQQLQVRTAKRPR